jgi:hypothetical protein
MRPSRLRRLLPIRRRTSTSSQKTTFTGIFSTNVWGDPESVSGPGSSQARGRDFQDDLIALFDRWHVRSMLDAPCGDFNWMRHVLADRQLSYTGVDIVEELIERNKHLHSSPNQAFTCADMTRAHFPTVDLILCRDGLVHLSFADAIAAIQNFRRSGSQYLLTTTFVDRSSNCDVATGGWRVLNMEAEPFCFPAPLELVDERCTHTGGVYRDKRLGLWRLDSIPA